MKHFLSGCVDRGKGNMGAPYGNAGGNQKTGPPSGYQVTDVAGGIIYVNWSDLQPSTLGSLSLSQNQALTGSGSGWTATGINLIDYALSQANGGFDQSGGNAGGQWYLVVRLNVGFMTPAWLGTQGNIPSYTYTDTSGAPFGTAYATWNSVFQQSYASLISLLAAKYDDTTGNHANLVCFTVTGSMNGAYQEPCLRGMGTPSNISGEASAGYIPGSGSFNTSGSDQWGQQQAMLAHQVFTNTYSDIAFNPYQYWNVGTSNLINNTQWSTAINWRGAWSGASTYNPGDGVTTGSGSTLATWVCKTTNTNSTPSSSNANWWGIKTQSGQDGKLFATTLMDQMRVILGGKGLFGNNSLRIGYNFVNDGNNYNDMYYQIGQRTTKNLGNASAPASGLSGGGSGTKIQTSTGPRLGGALTTVLDTCVSNGINWVELPGGYDQPSNDTGTAGPWWYLPPGTSGTTGSGGHATHGAGYYTTQLQANLAPNTGGGGGSGGGGTAYQGEFPASVTGPGGVVG